MKATHKQMNRIKNRDKYLRKVEDTFFVPIPISANDPRNVYEIGRIVDNSIKLQASKKYYRVKDVKKGRVKVHRDLNMKETVEVTVEVTYLM